MDKFIELSTRIVENFAKGFIGRREIGAELLYVLVTNLDVEDKFYVDRVYQKYQYYTNKGDECSQTRHHIEWLWHYIWDLKLINEFWQDKKGDNNE